MSLLDSTFLRHESCPQCNSRDNLGVWSDGHKWCFGCGFFVPPYKKGTEYVSRILNKEMKTKKKPELPLDASYSLPAKAMAWLAKYDVYQSEAVKHGIMWSQSRQSLIFPLRVHNELIFYQERKFEGNVKYLSYGNIEDHIPVIRTVETSLNKGIVIVVEDYISAVRVSERYDCVPLFGSHLSKKLATRLSRMYNTLGIWLDRDKSQQAIQFQNEYRALFDTSFVVISDLDPKAYTTNDIQDHIMDAEAEIYG